jgi:hypothetical protein
VKPDDHLMMRRSASTSQTQGLWCCYEIWSFQILLILHETLNVQILPLDEEWDSVHGNFHLLEHPRLGTCP